MSRTTPGHMEDQTDLNQENKKSSFNEEYEKMKNDPRILLMKQFHQHAGNNTYDHVCHVAEMSRKIEKGLRLQGIDEKALLRGALLHDYYQYAFRDHPISAWKHGTGHAGTALENAEAAFTLSERERNIIYSHMWPLNLTHMPRSREAWIVSCADKICAVQEAVFRRRRSGRRHT